MDEAGKEHAFSFDKWIGKICARFGLEKFFGTSSMFLLGAYTYTLAMFPERFKTAEQMNIATSNLHKMVPLDTLLEDGYSGYLPL